MSSLRFYPRHHKKEAITPSSHADLQIEAAEAVNEGGKGDDEDRGPAVIENKAGALVLHPAGIRLAAVKMTGPS